MKKILGLVLVLTAAGSVYAGELETAAVSAGLKRLDLTAQNNIKLPAPAPAQDVDLDKDYLAATAHGVPAAENKNWDGSGGFPPINTQSPVGACQSFAMTAFLEYIFYAETGKVIDLSEKYTAYSLLRFMIDEYWNEGAGKYDEYPQLGRGTDAVLIATILKYGAIPSADYPWGNLSDTNDPSAHLDTRLLERVFTDKPDREYDKTELLALLDEVFLSPHPSRFLYNLTRLNYATGREETIPLKTPSSIIEFLTLTKDRFTLVFNTDYAPLSPSAPPVPAGAMAEYLSAQAVQYGIPHESASASALFEKVVESLDRRMVVGLATDVWGGDWVGPVVDTRGGGHAIVIVGYQKRKDDVYFKIRNSWGTDIGINGYNYVSAGVLGPHVYWVKTFK